MRSHAVAACGLLLGCIFLATPVAAQSTRERLTNLEATVQRLERLLENNQAIQTDLLRRITELQEQNQTLRNDIDQLQFASDQGADRQRQLYLDLDSRLQALEARGGAVAATGTAAAAEGSSEPVLSDSEAYQAAFDQLKAGRYQEAQESFAAFLADYPASELRGNAQYWLAETHYVTQDFSTALGKFQTVIAEYPTTRKIPDAWLKVGFCNYELQRWDDARQALNIVVARYGESTAARLAEQRLQQMQGEGR